jgi:predicted Zn-dependent protease
MLEHNSKLNLVRIGSNITISSLKEIGNGLLASFHGIIGQIDLAHHESPMIDSIDAQLLTLILGEEYIGNTLGITDADLKIDDGDEFYNSILGGKNPSNDVAVVSTKKLAPADMVSEAEIDLFINRTTKVALHEVGHNFGLTDHASFKQAADGSLCPMSRGEFNKFGYRGYVRAIVDGRGLSFCNECKHFLRAVYGRQHAQKGLIYDGYRLRPASRRRQNSAPTH